MNQIVEKCPPRNVDKSLKNFPDPDTETDDVRNLISSFSSTDTSDW